MSATPLDPNLRERARKLADELCDELPKRVWVEGDGRVYGDFFGGHSRRRLDELAIVRLLHQASEKANQILSSL